MDEITFWDQTTCNENKPSIRFCFDLSNHVFGLLQEIGWKGNGFHLMMDGRFMSKLYFRNKRINKYFYIILDVRSPSLEVKYGGDEDCQYIEGLINTKIASNEYVPYDIDTLGDVEKYMKPVIDF